MPRRSSRTLSWERLRPALFFAGLWGAFLVGSGVQTGWGKAAFLVLLGLGIVLRPPTRGLPRGSNAALLLLLGWTLIQLIPGTAQASGWRESLIWAGVIAPSGAAALSLGSQLLGWVFLIAAVGGFFLAFEVTGKLRHAERRTALEGFGLLIAVLASVCAAMNHLHQTNPMVSQAHVFSFLANRNLMALLCAMGGVVCVVVAYERVLRHWLEGVVFLAGFLACLAGLVSLLSRAALGLFVVGLIVWLLSTLNRTTARMRLKILIPAGLLLLSLVFFFGETVILRFVEMLDPAGEGIGEAPASRLSIYRDTFALLPSVAWTGSGWGTFSSVIGPFREHSRSVLGLAHPENDYLWLWIEGGLPGLFAGLFLMGGIAFQVIRRWGDLDRYQRGAAIAASLPFLQAMVDGPLHSPTVMLAVFWLFGLALSTETTSAGKPLWLGRGAWRMLGGGLAVGGVLLCVGVAFGRPWTAQRIEELGSHRMREGAPTESVEAAVASLETAVSRFPLIWQAHSGLGRLYLTKGDRAAAAEAFRRARLVRADMGLVTWAEAQFWKGIAAGPTLSAWSETFLKRGIYDRRAKFDRILIQSLDDATLVGGLIRIGRSDPELRKILFSRRHPLIEVAMREVLRRDPLLLDWSLEDRRWMLYRVAEILGWSVLERQFTEHRSLEAEFPFLSAFAHAESTAWAEGGGAVVEAMPPPVFNRYGENLSQSEIRALFRRRPEDRAVAMAMLRQTVEAGEWEGVLEVLRTFRRTPGSHAPESFDYWQGRALVELGRSAEGAPFLFRYMRTTSL